MKLGKHPLFPNQYYCPCSLESSEEKSEEAGFGRSQAEPHRHLGTCVGESWETQE